MIMKTLSVSGHHSTDYSKDKLPLASNNLSTVDNVSGNDQTCPYESICHEYNSAICKLYSETCTMHLIIVET